MSTLSDLRARDAAAPRSALPERTYQLCLAQNLVAEAQELEERRSAIMLNHLSGGGATGPDGDQKPKPRRAAQKPTPPEVEEIDARLEQMLDEMRERTGTMLLRGKENGTWMRFVSENPPDKDSKLDEVVTYGNCDAEALFESLGDYVAAWNGEPLGEGDWDWIKAKAAPGDLQELCRIVVQMHVAVGVTAGPKLPSSSPSTPTESSGSRRPGSSASRRGGSSAGSPESDTTTSTPQEP